MPRLSQNVETALAQLEADVSKLVSSITNTYDDNKAAIDNWIISQKESQQAVMESVESLAETTKEITNEVKDALTDATSNINDYTKEAENDLTEAIVDLSESLETLDSKVKSQVESFVAEVKESVENSVDKISETVSGAATEVTMEFNSFGGGFAAELDGRYEELAGSFTECQAQLNVEYERVRSKFEELSDIYTTLTELIDLSSSGVEPATDSLITIMNMLDAVA